MKNCIFCNMLSEFDTNYTFIFKMKYGSLFLNHKQYYKGRCLFILNRHLEQFHDLDNEVYRGFNNELKQVGILLNATFSPDLINYALLGNHVQHVHWHLIPRYKKEKEWGNPPWPYPETNQIKKRKSCKIICKIKSKADELNILYEQNNEDHSNRYEVNRHKITQSGRQTISYPSKPIFKQIHWEKYVHFKKSWKYSYKKLQKLNKFLNNEFGENHNFSVLVAGSFGRMDAHKKSDLDFMVIHNGHLKNEEEKVASIRRIAKKLNIQMT